MRQNNDIYRRCIALSFAFAMAVEASGVELDRAALERLIEVHGVAGVGVAIIDNGRVAQSIYAGLSRPGVPVSAETMFNTASLAKTVTAEVALSLAAAGTVDIDAPIADHYRHPDLASDPRYARLTPRRILTHRSGLRNWVYDYDDFKLAFVDEPGETFSYSGAAYEILGQYLEAITGVAFPALATRHVFEPLGMKHASISREPWVDPLVAHPMNSEGEFVAPYTVPGIDWLKPFGAWDGADDLYVSAEDFARFVIAVSSGLTSNPRLHESRFSVATDVLHNPVYACAADLACPDAVGYGIGWMTFEYGRRSYFQHGGTDFGEIAFAYFDRRTGRGAVVLVNGGAGHYLPLDVIRTIDPANPLESYFRGQYDRYFANDTP